MLDLLVIHQFQEGKRIGFQSKIDVESDGTLLGVLVAMHCGLHGQRCFDLVFGPRCFFENECFVHFIGVFFQVSDGPVNGDHSTFDDAAVGNGPFDCRSDTTVDSFNVVATENQWSGD